MTNVLIADDHRIMREGLKQLFLLTKDIYLYAEAEDGDQLLDILASGIVDLVLLDMSMPGRSGTDLIKCIRKNRPDLPVLVLSMHADCLVARRALMAGANGYLTKDSDPDTLLNAIRTVAAGGRYIDLKIAEAIAFEVTESEAAPHEFLSDRELQVLEELVKGTSINDIAALLDLSNKTVSAHKANILAKMKLQSSADLVRYALSHQLFI
jgi:DNA-binding NarL/FixJ family response regulator